MALERLLVVGGGGFIGHHLCAAAAAAGYAVTSLQLRPGSAPPAGARALYADISDRAALAAVLNAEKFEAVVNCGGYIDHRPFRSGGRALIGSHFDGVQNLVELLDRDMLRAFVQIGSSDEYGGAPAPQIETMREAPISPYSLGKAATAHFLQMLWRTEQFPALTLRLFLTYGPGQNDARFLPQIIRGCLDDKAFPVSAGLQLRDFCYVGDIARGILRALQVPDARGEVINLASGLPVTIRSVIEQVRTQIGRGTPQFGVIPFRAGENPELYADISKAQRLLGWQPAVSLAEGLARTIDFYRGETHAAR